MALFQSKRYDGTYNQVPITRGEWSNLTANEDGESPQPDWALLYPINNKGQPTGLLSPRLACKLFHDGIYLMNKSDENYGGNPKFYQDRLPECVIKFYKKKQFRKQCIEAGRRVVFRLAKGMGFAANCVAEEIFVYIVLKDAFDLGWRRITQFVDHLPETDKDRDYNRVQRLTGGEDISFLYRTDADAKVVATKPTKESKETNKARESKTAFSDFRNWFHGYDLNKLHDHDIHITTKAEIEHAEVDTADE